MVSEKSQLLKFLFNLNIISFFYFFQEHVLSEFFGDLINFNIFY